MFITSPHTTLPNLIKTLDCFSKVSGLEVNQHKSTALNVSLPRAAVTHLQEAFPFQWATHFLPYLGVKLTSDPCHLYHSNYLPMLTHLTSHVQLATPLCILARLHCSH